MRRREFLKLLLLSGFVSLLTNQVNAEKKPERPLKQAMFWKRVD
jgi:hypothetical protein